jgi:hypothetical protein
MIAAEDRGTVVHNIAIAPGDIRQAALAPFQFFPDELDGAVEVILTALAGARLDWHRPRYGRDLEQLYSWRLHLPASVLNRCWTGPTRGRACRDYRAGRSCAAPARA